MVAKFLVQKFDNVYIEKDSLSSSVAQRVLDWFPSQKVHIIEDKSVVFNKSSALLTATQFSQSKKNLLLSYFKGQFFKRCPGARPGLVCCNYFVLNLGQHCEMDCSYCYLQSFINFPSVVVYTNIEKALEELSNLSNQLDDQPLRIGTGEITDSLSLDDLTLYSAKLVEYFKKKPKWTLEFKTKSSNVKNFVSLGPAKNVIVSWSLNPQYIIQQEEHGTASLDERLQSARLCLDRGFSVAFHLDPVIYHKNWEESYTDLVNRIQRLFCPKEVAHISLGALRFQPDQKWMMQERFGMKSLVVSGEYFKSSDGKLRYDSSLRQKMFRFIVQQFKRSKFDWNIFLCMENKESWLTVMNKTPWKLDSNRTKALFNLKPVRQYLSTYTKNRVKALE